MNWLFGKKSTEDRKEPWKTAIDKEPWQIAIDKEEERKKKEEEEKNFQIRGNVKKNIKGTFKNQVRRLNAIVVVNHLRSLGSGHTYHLGIPQTGKLIGVIQVIYILVDIVGS